MPRHPLEMFLFVAGAFVVAWVLAVGSGIDPGSRDLLDTDGYMRYLRIRELIEGGAWFDSFSERSNYPHGESQHWTRPLDAYVIVLSWLLSPILGEVALYWAALISAPLLLVGIGLAIKGAFGRVLPEEARRLSMLIVLGLPIVVGYSSAGRVDHHAAIIIAFLAVIGSVVAMANAEDASVVLAVGIVCGLWLSTEFLVPVGLTALSLGIVGLVRPEVTRLTGRAFGLASMGLALVLLVERGPDFMALEFDKVAVVHLALLVSIGGVLLAMSVLDFAALKTRAATLVGLGLAAALLLGLTFPGLWGGPFVEVDPVVREIWLYRVGELRPIWDGRTALSILLIAVPLLAGLMAGAWQIVSRSGRIWVVVVYAWLLVYTGLALFQVRWAAFGHLLAVPLILLALAPILTRLGATRGGVLVRPLFVVALIFGPYTIGLGIDRSVPGDLPSSNCVLDDVMPTIASLPSMTVVGQQDLGPEILYRTSHRVVATPYHRNESGILYVRQLMALPARREDAILNMLKERDVGLILVCPGRSDITRPAEVTGSFYEALTTETALPFLVPVPLSRDTDYLLFAVEN